MARVDALFLEIGISHLGGTPPEELSALVEDLSRKLDRPACLTYEDLVITNPDFDWRVFTTGEVGDSERGFYETHKVIEVVLGPAVEEMFEVSDKLAWGGRRG